MNWSYSAWYRWIEQAERGKAYGACASDTFYLGLRFGTTRPCPNGLEMDRTTPENNPAWRARIEKAKAFIERCHQEIRVRNVAGSITDEQLDMWIEALSNVRR